jgi:hypothetical protein
VRGPGRGEPVWELAQWSSRHPFDAGTPVLRGEDGAVRLTNAARSVSFGGDDGCLALAVNAGAEYGDRPRAAGEPWVHLLVEQKVEGLPRLGDLAALRFRVEARRLRTVLARPDGLNPRIHAAQFQVFLTVQNREKGSPGFGNYLWFGVPVYDNRWRMRPVHAARELAGAGKFIYLPSSDRFTRGSTHNAGWVTFDADVLPLIREGLSAARAKGFLTEQASDDGLRIAGLNLGWELPGSYDVEMQVRGLSLVATRK